MSGRSARTGTCCCTSPATAGSARTEAGCCVLVRGEGPYVWDAHGQCRLDGVFSTLFCSAVGYSVGEEMAAAASAQLTSASPSTRTGRPPTRRRSSSPTPGRARPRRPQPRVLHQRRLGVGRGGVEAGPPVPPGQRRAAADQGGRARDRLPRRHAGGAPFTGVHDDEGAVRAAGDPGRPRREHQRFRPEGDDRPRSARGCWTEMEEAVAERGPETVAMIIAEPVQNAGGCFIAARRVLGRTAGDRRPLRDLCSSPTR